MYDRFTGSNLQYPFEPIRPSTSPDWKIRMIRKRKSYSMPSATAIENCHITQTLGNPHSSWQRG